MLTKRSQTTKKPPLERRLCALQLAAIVRETLLLSANENPKIVAERLGHSSVKMTLDVYSHVSDNLQQRATDKLEMILYAK